VFRGGKFFGLRALPALVISSGSSHTPSKKHYSAPAGNAKLPPALLFISPIYKFRTNGYTFPKQTKNNGKVMALSIKDKIKKEFQRHEKDSGSAGVQAALLSLRINKLTEHLKANKKDHSSRYGLIKMVSARRKLLDYLARTDKAGYQSVIERLKLRR
jgi:small subunit ribosomal protein S15